MPTKKRPYIPKTKGCHECSQRRIHCDRTGPQCLKCTQKGLKCSGLGVRHRFNNGVAARGKWVGMSMEHVFQAKEKKKKRPVEAEEATAETADPIEDKPDENVADVDPTAPNDVVHPPAWDSTFENIDDEDMLDINVEDDISSSNSLVLFQPISEPINLERRHLMLHFSKHIASEMIAFDGPLNGWRHLILPLAQTDELVLNAVLAAADAHRRVSALSPREMRVDALNLLHSNSSQSYVCAIRGLRERQELVHGDQSSRLSIITTILVLLSAVMVTGSSDFPVLFRMLESAIEAMGGSEGLGEGEYTDFLWRQVNKMRVYAAPLVCEQTGVHVMSSSAQTAQLLDCLNHSVQQYPAQSLIAGQVSDLVDQARDIYLHQVFLDLDSSSSGSTASVNSIRRVQRFKESLEAIPLDSPVHKVLVWVTFVAASDCRLDEHKAFFEEFLQRRFANSGFGNLLKGLESLRKIWARNPDQRWTSILPYEKVLVM